MEELSSGELLLKEIMQGLIIGNDWANMKRKVADQLWVYTTTSYKAVTKVPEIDALGPSLRYQLLLEVVGPDMRELWGEEHELAYRPELLREPYVTQGMYGAQMVAEQNIHDISYRFFTPFTLFYSGQATPAGGFVQLRACENRGAVGRGG